MANVTPPKGNIPIGYAMVAGVRVPVEIDGEWLRYLAQSVFTRIGGVVGTSTTELVESAFEDAGIEELRADFFSYRQDASQRPVEATANVDQYIDTGSDTASLREEIFALRARVHALEQGATA